VLYFLKVAGTGFISLLHNEMGLGRGFTTKPNCFAIFGFYFFYKLM